MSSEKKQIAILSGLAIGTFAAAVSVNILNYRLGEKIQKQRDAMQSVQNQQILKNQATGLKEQKEILKDVRASTEPSQ